MSVAMRATANVDVVYNLAADMGGMLGFFVVDKSPFWQSPPLITRQWRYQPIY
jgi:hypothetical protein